MNEAEKIRLVNEYKDLKAKQDLFKSCPFFFNEPWGDQRAFRFSPARFRLMVGGNRTGKTTEGEIEAISLALGFRPDGSKTNLPAPPNRVAIVAKDAEKFDLNIIPKLKELVPSSWYTVKPNRTGGMPWYEFKNGSSWHFGTYNQEVSSKEGPDWDGVWFDEPPPRAMWIAYLRGLTDRGGRAWFTLTPLNCQWIYQDLYLKADGLKIANFSLDLMDNPYIPMKEKLEFAESIHPDEREARIHGKFSHLQGAIFPEFKRSVHVVTPHTPPDGCPIFMVMDPHDRRPSYLIWCYVDRRDRIVVFDEWPNEPFWEMKTTRMSVRDYAALIRDKEGKMANRVAERLIDPNFGKTTSHMTGTTLIEEYQEYDLDFEGDLENDIGLGHHRIHDALNHENRDPALLVTENCTNMIWAFENYIWRTKDIEGEFSSKERPSEIGKDQIDVIRYLMSYGPTYAQGSDWGGDHQTFTPTDFGGGYG